MAKKRQTRSNSSGSRRSAPTSSRSTPSRRGFAAMDPELQREISARGGRASHGGVSERGRSQHDSYEGSDYSMSDRHEDDRGRSRQDISRGFAPMDHEEQREMSARSGRASHSGRSEDLYEDEYDRGSSRQDFDENYNDDQNSWQAGRNSGKRGFAAIDLEQRRETSSSGGRSSHSGVRSGGGSGRRGQSQSRSSSR